MNQLFVLALNFIMVPIQIGVLIRIQFNNVTEAEATSKCNALDGETQVILTETYGLDCELK